MKSKFFRLLVTLVVMAMVAAPVSARQAQPGPSTGEPVFEPAEATQVLTPKISNTVLNEDKNASGPALYTVLLRQSPLASYDGSIAGLAATSPRLTGAAKLDAKSPESQAYRAFLSAQQDAFIASLENEFNRAIEVRQKYQVALNGFAAVLTPEEAALLAARSDVRLVERDGLNYTTTDVGPEWIGAFGIWDGSNTGGLPGTMGEGVVVGILDTGINADHPSFAEVGPLDGYVHVNPFGANTYVGVCDPTDPEYDPSFVCNDKLIGGWDFVFPPPTGYRDYATPEDENGHGSHTASTTAGNVVDATLFAPTTSINDVISGVAPHANVIIYDVCYENITTGQGSCPFVSTTAATEQAILDGVDVINYSIGGGEDPYGETTELAFLEAYAAGVFVSTSAGNEGPGASTVGHLGPWVSASAAATHNRALVNSLVSMSGGSTTPPGDIVGTSFTAGYGPAEIVYAGDYGDPLCPIGAFAPGTFSGEIVICDRGTHARVDKARSAFNGGAGGFILANDVASGDSLVGDAYVLPGVHITYADGVVLKAWVADGGPAHMGTITGTDLDYNPANGDVLASFSSRGPNLVFDVLKPNLTNPGVDIWAAYMTPDPSNPGVDEYAFVSGTSMASPHTAGAAALMTALYPNWSSNAILSALMMTADRTVLREDAATAADYFDMGAGRVDLNLAAETGLVLDETYANFVAADPGAGGDVKTLNTPSLTDSQCLQSCSWTRTFTSVAAGDVEYTITSTGDFDTTPDMASFTIAAGADQAVTFTADVVGLSNGEWLFGMVTLTPDVAGLPTLNIPVSVVPSSGVFPSVETINTRRDISSHMISGIQSIEVTELTTDVYGLVKGEQTTASIPVDPTNDDPYDDPTDGAFFVLVDVPVSTVRFVAETVFSEAADVDLFVGLDDGDGLPEEAELVCSSTTPTASERCNLNNPDVGTYWVLVQNWQASAEGAIDDITLSTGVVSADAGNMTVDGPTAVPELEPYDLTIYYDISTSVEGDRWYGAFELGSSPAGAGDIGMVAVDVVRHADDVSKTGPEWAVVGETVSYEIAVQPNLTPSDIVYTITDTLPAGLTLDPASVEASRGNVVVAGDTITWTVPMLVPYLDYAITTSATDPMCDTGFGGYVNLAGFGIFPNPGVSGDTVAYTAFSTGNPFNFFGSTYTGMGFTDDGFAIFDVANNYGGFPWTPQMIPNPALPNNVLAMLWQDMEIVYDGATTRGVSLATAGANVVIIEYDDVQLWGDPGNQYDFEIVATRAVDNSSGAYEFVFAYDNLDGDMTGPVTIGAENTDGTSASVFLNRGDASSVLSNGLMVCLDQVIVSDTPVLTFDALVDGSVTGTITNTVGVVVDTPGTVATSAAADTAVYAAMIPDAGDAISADEGEEVQFAASLIDPGVDSEEPTALVWDFGDGSPAGAGLDPTHVYADDGVYTATLTASYTFGDLTDTVVVTVANVTPVVELGADASLPLNTVFSREGSFADPGADEWTATVDYGDGSGEQALTLDGMTFELSHTYAAVGEYTVTVTVTDDEAAEGVASIVVDVTMHMLSLPMVFTP